MRDRDGVIFHLVPHSRLGALFHQAFINCDEVGRGAFQCGFFALMQ